MFSSLYWERLERWRQLLSIPRHLILQRMLCWDLLIQEGKQVSHDDDHGPLKSHDYLVKLVSSFYTRVELWRGGKKAQLKETDLDGQSPGMWLTGCGYEIEETLFREQRVFQPSKIQLHDTCHRVDVVLTLIIHQGVLTCTHIQLSVTANMAVHSSFRLQWSDAFMHLQKMACTSINMGCFHAFMCAVGQAVSPETDKCNLKSIKKRRQGTNLFQMHF